MDVRVGLYKKLSTEELMHLNCGVGEDSWESLGQQEIQPTHPKGNQSWIFTGRTDAETPILWPPDAKNWLLWKDPDAGKDWRWEKKGTMEGKMVGCHHQLDRHQFEQTPGVGDGVESCAVVHWVAKSWTWLSDWTDTSLANIYPYFWAISFPFILLNI